jgi:hypothetical protein
MAGAGKKTFIAGEVLTAAQVNDYLMDQAVMRFSGSAARAASITVPTEGMTTYLDDVNRLEFYNGAAWVEVAVESSDLRNLTTASAQVFVSAGAGSVVALQPGVDGQVLSIDGTASVGIAWKTPSSGGDAAYLQVAASGVTALPNTLGAGFYQIQTSGSTSYTDTEWRFVDVDGRLYGATITAGAGFFTLPVDAASLNITTGTFPFTVLLQEVKGVSDTLLNPPIVSAWSWKEIGGGDITTTFDGGTASIGVFNTNTGKFQNVGAAASTLSGASIASSLVNLGTSLNIVAVAANAAGVWSTASVTASTYYPFQVFTGNGTYTPPPWSTTADVLVVAGGGGGRTGPTMTERESGAGAGGAQRVNAIPTTGSVAVTVGAGGSGLNGDGSNSSFGPTTSTGGGGMVISPGAPSVNGRSGGAGSGGCGPTGAGGAGISGQGFPGGTGATRTTSPTVFVKGGGGGGVASAGENMVGPGTTQQAAGGSGSLAFGIWVSPGGTSGYNVAAPLGGPGYGANGWAPAAQTGVGGNGIVVVKANG